MRINNAPWIHHNGGMICSIDVHPEGEKVATAGHGATKGTGILIIWNIKSLWAEGDNVELRTETEKLASIPFNKCVNCVRWSRAHNGRYLATGGDEPEITIWEFKGSIRSEGSIGSNSRPAIREKYTAAFKLYGHSMDITHLEWSYNGWFLASCSADSLVIIWNARNFPERITTLDKNNGHADAIWDADKWQCVKTISEPFEDSARSVMFSRMDWSPDGSFLVLPCAMNNSGPTAQIVIRHDFSYKKDFVGHRKAVICARFCTRLIKYAINDQELKISLLALGSRDKSLSIWSMPHIDRPVIVIENLFKHSIIDLSWAGMNLFACSMDGTVKIVDLSEIGKKLSLREMSDICETKYGYRPRIYDDDFVVNVNPSPSKQPKIIDDVEEYRTLNNMGNMNGNHNTNNALPFPSNGNSTQKLPEIMIASSSDQKSPSKTTSLLIPKPQNSSNSQIEIRTKSGKKKITPVYLGPIESTPITTITSNNLPQTQLQPLSTSNDPIAVIQTAMENDDRPSTSQTQFSNYTNESNLLKRLGTFDAATHIDPKRPRNNLATEPLPVLTTKPVLRSLSDQFSVKATVLTGSNIIPLPEQRKQLRAPIYDQLLLDSIDAIQIDNEFSFSINITLTRIAAKCNKEKIIWEAFTGNTVSMVEASRQLFFSLFLLLLFRSWIAITTFQSTLQIYKTASGRMVFELALDSPASVLFLNGNFCMVVLTNGTVTTWNVLEQRQLMCKSLTGLVLRTESTITFKALTDIGFPVIGLDNSRFYVYSSSLNGWLSIQDSFGYTERNASLFNFITKTNPKGFLSKIFQQTHFPPNAPENLKNAIEESQLEKFMNTALSTNSGLEYRLLLNLYVQRLAKYGRDEKLADLIKDLNLQERICGISTNKLLSDILPIINQTQELTKLQN